RRRAALPGEAERPRPRGSLNGSVRLRGAGVGAYPAGMKIDARALALLSLVLWANACRPGEPAPAPAPPPAPTPPAVLPPPLPDETGWGVHVLTLSQSADGTVWTSTHRH